MREPPASARTQLRRHPERGAHDRATIDAILDEGLVCHVGFVVDGAPVVVPTLYARVGDAIFLHGSPVSRMLTHLGTGVELCLTVTLLDGLVLARSVFDHSVNYRSVMVFGRAHVVAEREEKMAALEALTEHVTPGRWGDARTPNERELEATTVLALPLEEISAKVRAGPPGDDARAEGTAVWAGVVPLRTVAGEPQPAAGVAAGMPLPAYLEDYLAGRR